MNLVQVEHKLYQIHPQDGITVAHFITVADIEPRRDFSLGKICPLLGLAIFAAMRRAVF
jgi:hypothetical protein